MSHIGDKLVTSRMDKSLICNFFQTCVSLFWLSYRMTYTFFSVSSLFLLQKIVGKLIFMFVSLYRVIVGMHFRQNVSYNEIILVLFYASHPTLIYFNSKIYYNNVIKLTNKIHTHTQDCDRDEGHRRHMHFVYFSHLLY